MQRTPTSRKSGSNAPHRPIIFTRYAATCVASATCYAGSNDAEGGETHVHRLDAILLVALALLLGAPCSAAAYKKKGSTPKQVSPRESITFTYTKPQYKYTQQRGNNAPCRKCN